MNLLLGEIKEKPGEEAEEDRAAPVSNDGDKELLIQRGQNKKWCTRDAEKQFTEIRKVQRQQIFFKIRITTKKRKPGKQTKGSLVPKVEESQSKEILQKSFY